LNGGDPDMSLRGFIDVAFAILVEEYQRLGTDLLTAIEKVGALGGSDPDEAKPRESPVDNARAMEQMMGMLGGVKGAPV
jgi:hypothetical protein